MGSLSGILPNDLVEEILLKLPVPCILGLKSVSRSWDELLSSPNFARTHSLYPHSLSQPCAIFLPFSHHEKSPIFTISLKRDNIMQLHNLSHNESCSSWMLRKPDMRVGCSNGILCTLTGRGLFTIVNPATGQSTCLPAVPGSWAFYFGFYFDPQHRSFRVFTVVSNVFEWKPIPKYHLFDSATGQWRCLESMPKKSLIFGRKNLVSIGHTCYTYDTMDCRLIGFDMVREAVEVVRAPSELQTGLELSVWVDHVAVLDWNGHVSLVAVGPDLKLIVWFLVIAEKKWVEMINIDLCELGYERDSESGQNKSNRRPSPVLVCGGHIFLIYGENSEKIMSYGFSSGRLHAFLPSNRLGSGDYLPYKTTLSSWIFMVVRKK
ncbi:F-box/LRR-repeat protein At2g43260-like [Amborella trichopoda]|uniref:F-box/LRR-repeat protein At2g43260-like n=1 Tax=Amborella trichopoda TaxID=13333 RepID=UPI0009BDEA5D|nr:F-box/LRR-repeat protein At2g43260-like [Amborella trichopoda]XP_020525530.1 F-box/LRR-repeat protein At2g43260-like [Amborella trichopoda]XP_020525532.1 F-box/LRR-repeat protein At2g43260-like [Amborella trichopoda]|eukprot:XP_020525529.1 F-box/LRR-repeat protein At2g43260-like [Amborella trichopoda]